MHPTLRSRAHNVFGVQLHKNNARALLLRILSILNSDWLQHARSVRGVYEYEIKHKATITACSQCLLLLIMIAAMCFIPHSIVYARSV